MSLRAQIAGAALAIAVAAGFAATFAVGAGALGSASAGGLGGSLGADAQLSAEVASDGLANTSVGGSLGGPGGSASSVELQLASSADGPIGRSVGSVRAAGLSLLGGRLVVSALAMSVRAEAGPGTGSAGIVSSSASGVSVDGAGVAVGPGSRVDIPGLGTAVFFEQVADPTGSVRANALRVEVAADGGGVPIGTQLVIGHLEASAAAGTVEAPPAPGPTTVEQAPAPAPAAAGEAPGRPATPPPNRRVTPDPTLPRPTPSRATPEPAAPARPAVPTTPADVGGTPATALPPPISLPEVTPTPVPLGLPRLPTPDLPPVAPTADGYVFPVYGQTSFTNDYGAPRAVTGWHHGNDIFGPEGLPVVAVADGVLSLVGVNRLGGNRLWLTDDRGNQFDDAHLQAYAPGIEDGVRVKSGQVLGFLGNTGQAITTPPHLHFEIHPAGGDSVNPYPYLLAWSRRGDVPLAFRAAALAPGSAPAAGALLVSYGAPAEVRIPDPEGLAEAVG